MEIPLNTSRHVYRFMRYCESLFKYASFPHNSIFHSAEKPAPATPPRWHLLCNVPVATAVCVISRIVVFMLKVTNKST